MKKKTQTMVTMTDRINGLAECYAALSARCTALEGKLVRLQALYESAQASCRHCRNRRADAPDGEQLMQEYFYGKRGEDDE